MLWSSASCSFLETDNSGKLGGFWHLERIDTLATGGRKDLSKEKRFWSVQGSILEVSRREIGIMQPFIFRYEHNGNTLSLSDARSNDREKGDPAVENVEPLRQYGINELHETFNVEALDRSKMQLKSNTLRLFFVKM
ncbi:MAG: lipocalin-like domain-containing protein [Prevotella sp.]|nr:lipocalin-like domain-containing protein [Prevotella sp.]